MEQTVQFITHEATELLDSGKLCWTVVDLDLPGLSRPQNNSFKPGLHFSHQKQKPLDRHKCFLVPLLQASVFLGNDS